LLLKQCGPLAPLISSLADTDDEVVLPTFTKRFVARVQNVFMANCSQAFRSAQANITNPCHEKGLQNKSAPAWKLVRFFKIES
jgi:hypothetical protein